MTERSSVGIARALRAGFARAASAPVVLVGTFAVARLLEVPVAGLSFFDRGTRAVLVWLVFWSIAYGGIIDRFARNRPTRAHGFSAACGGHAAALGRLAVVAIALAAALLPFAGAWSSTRAQHAVVALALALGSAVLAFARIRLVVEDRRSAFGALLASIRFLRRNPSGIVLMLGFSVAGYGASVLYRRFPVSAEALLAVQLWLKLISYASGIALFQGRLAHTGYTAAPPALWPDSPGAEAIINAPPRIVP